MASELWQRIRAARRHAGLGQQQVADLFGISRAAVSLWESSDPVRRTVPSIVQIKEVARLCKAPIEWMMDDNADLNGFWIENVQKVSRLEQRVHDLATGAVQPTEHPFHKEVFEPGPEYSTVDRWDEVISPGDTVPYRISSSFWRAVEHEIYMSRPELAQAFEPNIGIGNINFKPSFMINDVIVEFVTIRKSWKFPRAETLGKLLLYEKIWGGPLRKIVLGWYLPPFNTLAPEEMQAKRAIEAELCDRAGVECMVVEDKEQAVAYLQSLIA